MRGAATLPDAFDRSSYADIARNVEFVMSDQVITRRGFGQAWNPAKSITRMFPWTLAAANRLAYYNKTDGKAVSRDLATGTETDLATVSAQYADFASLGTRLAMTFATSAGVGAGQCQIWNTTAATADKAFPKPTSAFAITTTEPAAGTVTKGDHNLAVVFTTRTGAETRPCPMTASWSSSGGISDLVPKTVTASGSKSLRVTITPTSVWPADYVSAALLMTTKQNPARYFFVPGCTVTVTGGAGTAATFPDVNLADAVLAASSSTEAVSGQKNYFALWSQDSSGSGPFSPFAVLGYSDRTCYLTLLSDGTTALVVSNKYAPQWITLASHVIQLPEKRHITSMAVLRNSLYLFGPGWTYAVSDNGGLPVTWVPPQEIDGRIGSPSPLGVCANSSLGYSWVAASDGLYRLQGGTYPDRPVSYLNTPEWERINWAAVAGSIEVLDFPARKQVWVKAPLDGATAANYLMVWDYSSGTNWDKVNYAIQNSAALVDIGSMANVYNNAAKLYEVYLSSYTAGKVYRTKSTAAADTSLYNDDGSAIFSVYRSCALPKVTPEPKQIVAFRGRIRGSGTLGVAVYTLDATRSYTLASITASSAPGKWPTILLDMQSEALNVQITNSNAVDAWFMIAGWEVFWTDWIMQR